MLRLTPPLYVDIKPFYPLAINTLLKPNFSILMYAITSLMGVYDITYYFHLLIRNTTRIQY